MGVFLLPRLTWQVMMAMLKFLQVLQKHPAEYSVSAGERGKMQKMDDDPTPVPKIKAARTGTGVNQVAEVELCHNDEDMFPEGWEDNAAIPDSEDEHIAEQGEGQGPPNVSDDKLQQRNERAALDEVGKLFQMNVISQWCLPKQKDQQRMWLTQHWCKTGDSGMVNGQENAE